jgi:hypothetical protein
VRQAAEAHGGYARAENHPGGGALLRVSFGSPLHEDGSGADSRSAGADVRSAGATQGMRIDADE